MSLHDQDEFDPAAVARLRRLGGERLVTGVVEIFLTEAPKRREAFHRAALERDFHTLERLGHSLKSSAGNLGLLRLAALGREVEACCGGGQCDSATALVADVGRLLDQACGYLARLLPPQAP